MLGKAFEKFIDKAPVAVMVRGVLERVLNPDSLNEIYERTTVTQDTRKERQCVYNRIHIV